jgi:hypothetical protein
MLYHTVCAADAFVMNGMVYSLGSRAVCYFNICIKYIAKYTVRHVQYLSIGNQSNSSGQKSAKNSGGENPGINHTSVAAKKDTKHCCTCFPRYRPSITRLFYFVCVIINYDPKRLQISKKRGKNLSLYVLDSFSETFTCISSHILMMDVLVKLASRQLILIPYVQHVL